MTGYQEWLLKHWHLSSFMTDIWKITVAVRSCAGMDGKAMHTEENRTTGQGDKTGVCRCGM